MKKLFALLLVLSLAVCTFASCGGDTEDTTAGTNASTDTVATEDTANGSSEDTGASDTVADTEAQTEANTDPEIVLGEDEVYRFEFKTDSQVAKWHSGSAAIVAPVCDNGVMVCEIDGGDPYIECRLDKSEQFPVDEIKKIEIKVKNNTDGNFKGQFRFETTSEDSYDFGYATVIEYTYKSLDWDVITIDLSGMEIPEWDGNMLAIRFDVEDAATIGDVSIEYISFKK